MSQHRSRKPLVAYKFMPSRFVANFLLLGRVRISAAAEFRLTDGTIDGRSDLGESVGLYLPAPGDHRLSDFAVFQGLPLPISEDRLINLGQTRLVWNTQAYLFCASLEITPNICEQMQEKFGADRYIRISDFELFLAMLAKHPRLLGRRGAYGDIRYGDRGPDGQAIAEISIPPSLFLKPRSFAWQREVRAVWEAPEGAPEGFVIDDRAVVPLLSLPRQ